MADKTPTSKIAAGIQTALSDFSTSIIPEDLANAENPVEELGAANVKSKDLLDTEKKLLAEIKAVKDYYQHLSADPLSLLSEGKEKGEGAETGSGPGNNENILVAIDSSNAEMVSLIASLGEEPLSTLPDNLIKNAKDAKSLSNGFSNITSATNNLMEDIKQGDEIFKNLPGELQASLKELTVKGGNNKTMATTFKDVKSAFESVASKLTKHSLDYQSGVASSLSEVTRLQSSLVAKLEALNTNLTDNNTAVTELYDTHAGQVLEHNASLDEDMRKHELLTNIQTFIVKVKAEAEASDSEAEASNDEPVVDPNAGIDKSIVKQKEKADKKLKSAEANISETAEIIKNLKAVIADKSTFDGIVDGELVRLKETQILVDDLTDCLGELNSAVAKCIKNAEALCNLTIKIKQGDVEKEESLTKVLIDSLNELGSWEAMINGANDELQKVEQNGDIKTYVSSINEILGGFPEAGSTVVSQTLSISKALGDLHAWANDMYIQSNSLETNYPKSSLANDAKKEKAKTGLDSLKIAQDKEFLEVKLIKEESTLPPLTKSAFAKLKVETADMGEWLKFFSNKNGEFENNKSMADADIAFLMNFYPKE